MSDPMLDYYKSYYAKGGEYSLTAIGKTSRVLQFCTWIKEHTPLLGAVLDIGCGDFAFSRHCVGYAWTGIDINVDRAESDAAIKHDITSTPYPLEAESFDTIICSEVLEHVWDMRVIHKEAHRLLKPGGTYIVSTPNFDWLDNIFTNYRPILFEPKNPWTLEHIRHYTPDIHEKYLQEAGFQVVDFTGADAHFGVFFKHPRLKLQERLLKLGHKEFIEPGKVDQLLGEMFPATSHTIILRSVKA